MIAARRAAAALVATVVMGTAACRSGEQAGGPMTTGPAATATPGAPSSAPSPTTSPASSAPSPTTRAPSLPPTTDAPVTAADATAGLVVAVERFRDDVLALVAEIERGPVANGAAEAPGPLDRRAVALATRFWTLVELVPLQADVTVRNAALAVVFAAGGLAAPFLDAAGWRVTEWMSTWRPAIDDAGKVLPRTLGALQSAARARPRLEVLDPAGEDRARRAAAVQVLTARSVRVGEFTAVPRYALGFVTALPPGGARCDESHQAGRLPGGGFVAGVGGCAVLVVGSDTLSSRAKDIAAFLADPNAELTGSPLDLVTVRRVGDRWDARSSLA